MKRTIVKAYHMPVHDTLKYFYVSISILKYPKVSANKRGFSH